MKLSDLLYAEALTERQRLSPNNNMHECSTKCYGPKAAMHGFEWAVTKALLCGLAVSTEARDFESREAERRLAGVIRA